MTLRGMRSGSRATGNEYKYNTIAFQNGMSFC